MTNFEMMEIMAYFDKRIGEPTTAEEETRINYLLAKKQQEQEEIERDIKRRVW